MRFIQAISLFQFIRKRKKVSIVVVVILILTIFFLRPKPVKVIETQTITEGTIVQSLSASGTVTAQNAVNLNFISGGKLASVEVKRGNFVKQGQVIATLDQRSAQKNLELALRDYANQRITFDKTLQDNNSKSITDALNENMKRILETNQNNLDKAQLSIELQDLAKQQAVLTTPISGVVTRADVTTPGVNVNATATYSIADPSTMVLQIDVDEADIGRISEGQTVKVTLDSYPNNTLNLAVSSIDFASHATSTGGTAYTVEATLPDNSDYRYKIGMSGDAEIILAQRFHVLTLPLSSLIDDAHVYVQNGKTYEKRIVRLGIKNDTDAQILSGLKAGEKVAVQPSDVDSQVKSSK